MARLYNIEIMRAAESLLFFQVFPGLGVVGVEPWLLLPLPPGGPTPPLSRQRREGKGFSPGHRPLLTWSPGLPRDIL